MKNKTVNLILVVVVLAILAAAVYYMVNMKEKPSGTVVAIVNGVEIPKDMFQKALSNIQKGPTDDNQDTVDAPLDAHEKEVLEHMINTELLIQEANRLNVQVEESKLDEQMANFKKQYSNLAKFEEKLTEMGLTEEEFRAQIKKNLMIQQLINVEIEKDIVVEEEEARSFYDSQQDNFKQPEQVRASHILIKVEPDADEKTKTAAHKKIEELQKKLKKGADFAELAKSDSDCPSSSKGGDLGFFGRGSMVKPFEDAAFVLKKDEMSDIVETRFGYHIIKITDKKAPSVTSFEDMRDRIIPYLRKQRVQQALKEHIEDLKTNAKIEILVEMEPDA